MLVLRMLVLLLLMLLLMPVRFRLLHLLSRPCFINPTLHALGGHIRPPMAERCRARGVQTFQASPGRRKRYQRPS